MTQSTILASGSVTATSSDVTVAVGGLATIGMFGASDMAQQAQCIVYADTPGADVAIATLTRENPVVVIAGPCTVRVKRVATGGRDIGVFLEA